MKILHLSTTDMKGGAGIAALRLHKGLIKNGVESEMFVQRKYGKTNNVLCSKNKFNKLFDLFCRIADKSIAHFFGPNNYEITSPALFASLDLNIINKLNPDIIHLHWICGGFLNPEKIGKIKKPIIWTIHDMWPFSGINHYNFGDKDYTKNDFQGKNFLDKWTWKRKKKSWKNLNNLTIVSPSRWLMKEAKSSHLFKKFRIENIPNGIDTKLFKKHNKFLFRKKYGFHPKKKLLLFGAVHSLSNERKGYKLLIKIIRKLLKTNISDKIALIVFGSQNENKINFGLPTYFIKKKLSEEDLGEIYSTADIFIAPSIEDNLPNTVLESMSCGTPTVAFNIGGIPDIIDDKNNGILIPPFNENLMVKEIVNVLNDEQYQKKLSINARRKILKKFEINLISKKYFKLYKSIL